MKKKIIIGVSAAVIVIAAIAAGVIMGVSSKKKSSNDINVSCKAVVTKNDDITCYDWLKKLCNKMGIEVEDYRKAAKENGYITDSDEFSDGDIASGGFMALASVLSIVDLVNSGSTDIVAALGVSCIGVVLFVFSWLILMLKK